MAQLQSVRQTWDQVKEWVFLALGAALIWNFWGFFKSLGDAAKSGADATLGGLTQAAEDKADKAKAKAASGGKTDFTDAQIAQFKQDAEALVNMLGRGKGLSMVDIVKDQRGAFAIIKQRYSFYNLYNNKPWKWGYDAKHLTGKAIPITQSAVDKNSVKNAINWRVLEPFYNAASGGHNLNADFRYYVTSSEYTKYFKWILG